MTPSKRKQHEANLIEKEKHEKSQSISSTSKYSDTDYEFGKSNEKKKKKGLRRDRGAHRCRLASKSKCDHRASDFHGRSYWITLPFSSLSLRENQKQKEMVGRKSQLNVPNL